MQSRANSSHSGIIERMMDAFGTPRQTLVDELVQAFSELGLESPLEEPGLPVGRGMYRLGLDLDPVR